MLVECKQYKDALHSCAEPTGARCFHVNMNGTASLVRGWSPIHLCLAAAVVLVIGLGAAAIWRIHTRSLETTLIATSQIRLRPDLSPDQRLTAHIDAQDVAKCLLMYTELTGRKLWPITNSLASRLDESSGGRLSSWKWISPAPQPDSGIRYHADGMLRAAEAKETLEAALTHANLQLLPVGTKYLRVQTLKPGPSG
jgi:hypothetical protein